MSHHWIHTVHKESHHINKSWAESCNISSRFSLKLSFKRNVFCRMCSYMGQKLKKWWVRICPQCVALYQCMKLNKKNWRVYNLMEKCSELYPPFLMPSGTIAQVHQVLHLLHCFDGGHLETTATSFNFLDLTAVFSERWSFFFFFLKSTCFS